MKDSKERRGKERKQERQKGNGRERASCIEQQVEGPESRTGEHGANPRRRGHGICMTRYERRPGEWPWTSRWPCQGSRCPDLSTDARRPARGPNVRRGAAMG